MARPLSAIAAGHLCLDIFPDLRHTNSERFMGVFKPGRLIDVGAAGFSTGGAVSNTGLVLSRLGIPTQLMAKVGEDPFAQIVRGVVGSFGEGLLDGIISDRRVPTSYTIIINVPGMDRIFLHCPGANDVFGAADVDYQLIASTALFHFGYPPLMRMMYADGGVELTKIMQQAKQTGVTTSLDLSFPDVSAPAGLADWRAILKMALPFVDLFLPSIEEILFMLRRKMFDAMCEAENGGGIVRMVTPDLLSELSGELLAMGAKVVGLKLGDQGFYLRTGKASELEKMGRAVPSQVARWAEKEMWTPCFQVNLVGATGAGDATIAGFLSALLRDLSPEQAVTAAVAVGACNVEAADALSGIRTWEATMERIAQGWKRRPLELKEAGWKWDEKSQIWFGAGK